MYCSSLWNRDYKKEFAKADTVVLALSPDAPKDFLKFEERDELNFDLLSDEDHVGREIWSKWPEKNYREYMGIVRSTFNVGGKMVLYTSWIKSKLKTATMMYLIGSKKT